MNVTLVLRIILATFATALVIWYLEISLLCPVFLPLLPSCDN